MSKPGEGVMSWKVQYVIDNSDQWASQSCRFRSKGEAEKSAEIIADNWGRTRQTRIVETDRPANYKWVSGEGNIPLENPKRKPKLP